MQTAEWLIDFRFPYPGTCTPPQVAAVLEKLAVAWPGWERFPWRVTRSIHKFLGRPPVNFHYLLIHRCLMGFAAHLVLKSEFESRPAVLAMMARERFEIGGVLRVLLIDAVRAEMRRTGLPYILDCSGPEDGHKHVPPPEIEKRRRDFQTCAAGAIEDFVKIVNLASEAENLSGTILGRSLRSWARGGDLPDAVQLAVQVEETAAGKVVKPCQAEVVAMLEAGRPVPKVVIRDEPVVRSAQKPAASESPAMAGGTDVGVVGAALKLASVLDANPRVKAPNHMTVLKMYCLDGLTIGKIARKCGCVKGTVINRKAALERQLGQSLDVYRGISGMTELLAAILAATPERKELALKFLRGELTEASRPAAQGPLLVGMGAAAAFLGVSRPTLWRVLQVGKIPRVELFPGSYRVRREDLEALAAGKFGLSGYRSRRGRPRKEGGRRVDACAGSPAGIPVAMGAAGETGDSP